ncbi:hypothetical protein E2562_030426, partial [Oryza meyeriana var. granulata]
YEAKPQHMVYSQYLPPSELDGSPRTSILQPDGRMTTESCVVPLRSSDSSTNLATIPLPFI